MIMVSHKAQTKAVFTILAIITASYLLQVSLLCTPNLSPAIESLVHINEKHSFDKVPDKDQKHQLEADKISTRDKVKSIFEGVDLVSNGRGEVWPIFLEASKDRLWFGHGTGSTTMFAKRNVISAFSQPHNDYLKILYNNGILGLLFFTGLIVSLAIFLIS